MNNRFNASVVGLCCAFLIGSVVSKAQTPTAVEPDKVRSDTTKAPPIVVTVTRVPEQLTSVPLAITVVPEQQLESQRGMGLDGVLSLVPGVVAQSRSGGIDVRVQIRGFGARGAGERSNAGTTRGVRFYQDGIPETEPDGRTAFELINLVHASKLEVIRSNSSALWGNASGGVVSLSSVPQTQKAFVDVANSIGSFGLVRQDLLANAPLGQGQVYVSLVNTNFDGWRDHSNSSILQGTLGFVTKPTINTKLNIFLTGASNFFKIPGPLTQQQFEQKPQQAQGDTNVYMPTYVTRDERRNNRVGRIGTTFEHRFNEEHTLTSMGFLQSKYLERSERNTYRDFNRYHTGGNVVYAWSKNISGDIKNRLLVGADAQYQDGAILFYSLSSSAGRGQTIVQNKREGALSAGTFLQEELMFHDVHINAGARFDNVVYFFQDYLNPKLDDDRNFHRITPKLGISYALTGSSTLYANLGGGIEVPAGNETDPPAVQGLDTISGLNPLLDAISSTTYEIGYKGAVAMEEELFTSLAYDVAAYMIDIKNDIIPYRDGRFYITAGTSRRMGVEFGGAVETKFGLQVILSVAYMKSEYVNFVIDSSFIRSSSSGKLNFSGNEQSGIPALSGSFRLRYNLPEIKGWFAELEARHLGSYFVDDANTISVNSFTLLNAAAGVRVNIIENWLALTALGRVDNIFNSSYIASAWVNPNAARNPASGFAFAEPGLPFSYMVTIGVSVTP